MIDLIQLTNRYDTFSKCQVKHKPIQDSKTWGKKLDISLMKIRKHPEQPLEAAISNRKWTVRSLGEKGPRKERQSTKKYFKKGNDPLSQVIQCFYKMLTTTASGLFDQQRRKTCLNLHTLRCLQNTETQGYREQQRPKLPKAPLTYTDWHDWQKLLTQHRFKRRTSVKSYHVMTVSFW